MEGDRRGEEGGDGGAGRVPGSCWKVFHRTSEGTLKGVTSGEECWGGGRGAGLGWSWGCRGGAGGGLCEGWRAA